MALIQDQIQTFFLSPAFAVAGASSNRQKYGNKVLRCYLQNNKKTYPINPRATEIEGIPCLDSIDQLPPEVQSLSIITPPAITEEIVKAAIKKGIKNIWMQPGAESEAAIQYCHQHNVNVIAHGPCVLIELGFQG